MVGASHGRLTHGCSLGNGTLPNSSTPSLAGWLEGTVRTGPDVGQGLPTVPAVPPRCLSLSSAEPTCLPPWCWAPSTASPVWFWFLGSGSSRVSPCGRSRVARGGGCRGFVGTACGEAKSCTQLAPLWSSPRRDVKLQLLAQLSCTRTRWHRPPVPPIAAPATPLSLPRAPQPPGEGWAALHPLPEDDRGTQALHPAALWLPFRLPGLPGVRAASAGGELGGGEVTPHAIRDPTNVPVSPSQVMQGIFAFFCTHAAGLAGKFQHLVLVMLVSGCQRHPKTLRHRCQPARMSPGQRPAVLGDVAELLWFLLRSRLPSLSPSGSGF